MQKLGIITARLADGAVRRSHHRIGQHPEQVSQLHRQFVHVGSDVVGAFTYYHPSGIPFPKVLDSPICNRCEIVDFAREAYDLGVSYFGVCCGSAPHQIRSMAEALGRTPSASRYSEGMSKHAFPGSDTSLKIQYGEYRSEL